MAKYLKQDSDLGYVENSAEIEYLKLNNLRHSILGFMLGDFDEQGYYTISTEIQKELLSMRKFIVNSVDNIDICHGVVMLDKPITFMVTFERDRATLSLVEKISYEANKELNSGSYSNVNEFILDEVETAGEINRNLVYKRWNIGEFGGEVLGINNMDATTLALYSGLVNRYKYLLAANKILLEKEEELENIEAEYSIGMIEILSRYPAIKTLVDEEVKAEIQDKTKFLRLDKPNFAKTFNEILDKSIENNLGALNGSELNMFSQEKREVVQQRNMRMQSELDVKQQTSTEEETNQTELDEEFGERTDKKIVMDAGNYAEKSVGELQTEFNQTETSITDLITDAALAYAAGKIFGKIVSKIVAGRRQERGLEPNEQSRYDKNRQGIYEYTTETSQVNGQEFLGDETREVLNEIEAKANAEHGVEPAAVTPETKKQEKETKADKNNAKNVQSTKRTTNSTGKTVKSAPASGKSRNNTDKKQAQAKTTPARSTGSGGLISDYVNGNTNEAQQNGGNSKDVNLGRATGRAPASERKPATREPKTTFSDVDITEKDVRNFQQTVADAQRLVTKTNERNISGGLGLS